MIASKQTGPLSRAELVLKVATGAVTGRSYVWKDGMAGWVRAADVAELASLFAAPPGQKPAPIPSPVATPALAPKPAPDPAPAFEPDVEVAKPAQQAAARAPSSPGRLAQPPAGATATGPQVQAGPGRAAAQGRPPEAAGKLPEPSPLGAGPRPGPQGQQAAGGRGPQQQAGGKGPADGVTAAASGGLEVKDLFASVESTGGHNAVDLAKWASAELSKKTGSPASSAQRRMTPPSSSSPARGPLSVPAREGTGKDPGGRRDGLSGVPVGPGVGASIDTTGKVLAKSGVTQNRTPMLIGLILLGLVVIGGLVYVLLSRSDKPLPPPPPEAPKASLGGTGDTTVGKLAKQEGAGAPKADKGTKLAQADPAKGDKLTKEQVDALKSLDNDRGVGGHAPSGAAAPDPAKATPGLSSAEIRKTLVENQGGLRACISEAQRRDPNLKVGKIKVSLLIAPSGTVTESKIDNASVDGSPLGECLKKATRRLAFPSFAGEPFPIDIPIQVTAGN
jgi:hypothetical protein